jgi:hypothetical protein
MNHLWTDIQMVTTEVLAPLHLRQFFLRWLHCQTQHTLYMLSDGSTSKSASEMLDHAGSIFALPWHGALLQPTIMLVIPRKEVEE